MRNVFHQYSHPENRLSHALATAVSEDNRLLKTFLRWACGAPPGKREKLHVVEQQVPGEIEDGADEDRGLPDIAIFGDDGFCLLIESKIAANLSVRQLQRHRRTAERAGFPGAQLLVLATGVDAAKSLHEVAARSWPELYTMMLGERSRSEWASRLVDYMEVAESNLAQNGYLREGTLTQFSGIPFDDETPYRYSQAKRLLRLMLAELRTRRDLIDLGIAVNAEGRPAITGSSGQHVWDLLRLRDAESGAFTKHPHLTLSLHAEHLGANVTLPNDSAACYRQQLKRLGAAGLQDLVGELAANIERSTRSIDRARPVMYVVQRHYTSQRAKPIEDARLTFDLRTTLASRRRGVRLQPEWIDTVYRVLSSKRSNIQLGIGAEIPYDSELMRSRRVLDVVAAVWTALTPWLREGLGVAVGK